MHRPRFSRMANPACPACSGLSTFVVTRAIDVFACNDCKLIFAEADSNVIDCHEAFWVDAFESIQRQERKAREMAPARGDLYARALGRPVRSILEIGCGLAPWANAWAGIVYAAVEYLPEVAEAARKRSGADIRTGDFLKLDIPERFDVVFCSQVLEHAKDPLAFLVKAKSLGHVLHVDVPNQASLTSSLRRAFGSRSYGMLQPPHHLRAYTSASLKYVLERAGFSVSLCAAFPNDHPVFGQPGHRTEWRHKVAYAVAAAAKRGSLLAALARSAEQ